MNLRFAANRLTSRVNPNLPVQVQVCTGYSTAANGKRAPVYADPVAAKIQMQALTKKEIEHLDALNIAGTETACYADMQLSGIDRKTGSGGDLITFGSDTVIPADLRGTMWRVTATLEGWVTAGWSRAGLTRQMS